MLPSGKLGYLSRRRIQVDGPRFYSQALHHHSARKRVPSAQRMVLPGLGCLCRTQAPADSGTEALAMCQLGSGERQPDGCGVRMALPSGKVGSKACWHCLGKSEGQPEKQRSGHP
ncbi:hypothetical protein SRHO_G00183760 [Serrasalmus rhombeus]